MKFIRDIIDNRRIVDKILISLTEQFDPMVLVIEEIDDLLIMIVQGLMGHLDAMNKDCYTTRMQRSRNQSITSAQSQTLLETVKETLL